MRAEDRTLLKSTPLFAALSASAIDRLTYNAFVQNLPAGAVLFQQGDQPEFLYILLAGRVALTGRSTEGDEAVIEFFRRGDVFIAPAVVLDLPYLMSTRVLQDARILMIPAEHFREVLARDAALNAALVKELSRHWRLLIRQIKDLKLRTAPQRLAAYLLDLSGGNGGSVELPEERRFLAGRLGMTPESLSRAFAQLQAEGVTGRGRHVSIADAAHLRKFCAFDEIL
ncbi:MAG TPA: cyclic nucleotide-binding domain-containing protein [Alphaproteobacteria bacterium]|jgi:CRP/FNR family transcriptional activator FtrB